LWDALGGDGMTQSGRVLHALNIDIICFKSSQAKKVASAGAKTGRILFLYTTATAGGFSRNSCVDPQGR